MRALIGDWRRQFSTTFL